MQQKWSIVLIALMATANLQAQNADLKNWYLKGKKADGVNGVNLAAAYNLLQGKKSIPITVAVIDSGIDTTHEDLKEVLWVNKKEIAGNGIDDDKNGYVDDVHGWNFLGNKNGRNLIKASDEKSRVYHAYKSLYLNNSIDTNALSAREKPIYIMWKKAADGMEISSEEASETAILGVILKNITKADSIIKNNWKKEIYTVSDLDDFTPTDEMAKKAKLMYLNSMRMLGQEPSVKNNGFIEELNEYVAGKQIALTAKDIAPEDVRAKYIGDDYNNFSDKYYGNADVTASFAMHGTHVAGIIAAVRNNGKGMDGIADNVKIMAVRTVPQGDEYDKDVALAIRYAVDNGAKVINMSFGKSFSPEKKWVDDAVAYAASKDVLLVHAAGNDAKNIDSSDNFPNAYLYGSKSKAVNMITVGASSDESITTGKAIASFSNYGKQSVDVFAPGVKIYSTIPTVNSYDYKEGTSMAAPVVTGIAALIRSYFPKLSAVQVKYAIEKSCKDSGEFVNLPNKNGEDTQVALNSISVTGGIVDAGEAVSIAASLTPTTKPKTNKK